MADTSVNLSQTPFSPSRALNTDRLRPQSLADRASATTTARSDEQESEGISYIPGDPAFILAEDSVRNFISRHFDTAVIDELYDRLWMVGRKSGDSIEPLHLQRARERNIVPIEDHRLHLVWQRDKIYVKPVPICLLNHEFWTAYLSSAELPLERKRNPETWDRASFYRPTALGFMRSYAILVQSRLDLIIAKESHLIPDDIEWTKWSKFISSFRQFRDDEVAKRYHYGQLRLSRLNWATRLFRPHNAKTVWFYEIPHWSIASYLTKATVPLLFLFASLSLVLSSMQVVLSVPGNIWHKQDNGTNMDEMSRVFWVFSIAIILLSAAVWLLMSIIPLCVLIWQLVWGFRNRKKQMAIPS